MRVSVKVWDPFLRLFHWSLVVSFAVAWVSAEDLEALHIWAGYAAGALVVFRVLWGLVGPRYARFGQFVRTAAETKAYLRDIAKGCERRYMGHNPAGGAMILAILAVMTGTFGTGWLYTTDMFWGVEWVEDLHELFANLMLILVVLHISGVMFSSRRHKENLVRAMITGYKRAPAATDVN